MKSTFVLATSLLLACTAQAAEQEKPKETGPAPTAAHFMAQFYNVKPAEVGVTIIKRDAHTATAVTKVEGQRTCSLELAEAGTYVRTEFGWLVGGLSCDKSPVAEPLKG